jgi:hypothetical protein
MCLFPKGRRAGDEVALALETWRMRIESISSRSDPDATILKITEVRYVGPHGDT